MARVHHRPAQMALKQHFSNLQLFIVIAAAFAYGLLAGWGVFGTPDIGGRLLASDNLAEWVQAVGSVAAIFFAVYIANQRSRELALRREQDRVARARPLAIVLRASIEEWLQTIADFEEQLIVGNFISVPWGIIASGGTVLAPPESIVRSLPRLHVLDAKGHALLTAIYVANEAAALSRTIFARSGYPPSKPEENAAWEILEDMRFVASHLRMARADLRDLVLLSS